MRRERHAIIVTEQQRGLGVEQSIGLAERREHRVVDVDLGQFGGSALTDRNIDVPMRGVQPGIPATYVPACRTHSSPTTPPAC